MGRSFRQNIGAWLRACVPVNRRTFDSLRFELGCLRERILNALSPRYHIAIRRLSTRRALSVNVGSGGHGHKDWVNLDARPTHRDIAFTHDVRRRFPLTDGCARRILAEHVIEHLDVRDEVPRTLAEFHRLLEPGGRVRIVVPDVVRYLEAYLSGDWAKWKALGWDKDHWPSDILSPMHAVNHAFHQSGEHYFGYDEETLRLLLKAAGFSRVTRFAFGQSEDPTLAIDRAEHAQYSLYIEAVK